MLFLFIILMPICSTSIAPQEALMGYIITPHISAILHLNASLEHAHNNT
jgi:hypothetical protein